MQPPAGSAAHRAGSPFCSGDPPRGRAVVASHRASVPPQAPSSDRPLPSIGFPGVSSPTSQAVSADSDFSPPSRLTSSPSLGTTTASPSLLPRGRTIPRGQDDFYRGARGASSRWRRRDIPGSWANLAYMPRSQTPADRRPQATTGPAMWPSVQLTILTPRWVLTRLNHAACTISVYASQPESPLDYATLDSDWWPALTGQDSRLLGRIVRFPSCLSLYMASSFTRLRLAQ